MRALQSSQRLFLRFFPKKRDDVVFEEYPRSADLGAGQLACAGEFHCRVTVDLQKFRALN